MSDRVLNLASEPFVNNRPLVRVTLAMWILGTLLMASNAWLYWRYFTGSADGRAVLAQLNSEADAEEDRTAEVNRELSSLDLAWQREQVVFLNTQIAARTFSWSRLLDRVVEVLPADVRLLRLDPSFTTDNSGGRPGRAGSRSDQIALGIDAQAKTDEDVLAFLDALYAHDRFVQPSLLSENLRDGTITFRIDTFYLGFEDEEEIKVASEGDAAETEVAQESAEAAVAPGEVPEPDSAEALAPVESAIATPDVAARDARAGARNEVAAEVRERQALQRAPAAREQAAPAEEEIDDAASRAEKFFADLSEEGADEEFKDLFGDLDEGDGES